LSFFSDSHIIDVANQFLLEGSYESFEVHGNGNVNDTYLLKYISKGSLNRYTLQRINHEIFKDPRGLMENFCRVTEHLQKKFENSNSEFQSLSLVRARDQRFFHVDKDGNFWRVTKFIDGGRSFDVPKDLSQAYQAAKSFGDFQYQLNDLPGKSLVETIPDFHNTKLRFEDFCSSVKRDSQQRLNLAGDLVDFAFSRENLSNLISSSELPIRIVHNDTKLNNVLLHKTTGNGMCVVDLDTVMPGCVLHDFGDLARTAACSATEDEIDLSKVFFKLDTFEVITKGYLETTAQMLVKKEIEHLAISPLVITYELGLRFLSDFLEGDIYFKIKYPKHNLDRAKVQFKLLASMEDRLVEMKDVVRKISSLKEKV
jgi:thiamine kinase-like enzyme